MNPTAFYTTLGVLVNSVLTRVLTEIEDQSDISEQESIRLNSLCKILHGLEKLFMLDEKSVRVVISSFDHIPSEAIDSFSKSSVRY